MCGDGVAHVDEECDRGSPGAADDGCSAACAVVAEPCGEPAATVCVSAFRPLVCTGEGWAPLAACAPGGQVCIDGACVDPPVACSAEGLAACAGDYLLSCRGDSWVAGVNCSDTQLSCREGVCRDGDPPVEGGGGADFDGNDTPGNAKLLDSGQTIEGLRWAPGDDDYFKVALCVAGTAAIEIDWEGDPDALSLEVTGAAEVLAPPDDFSTPFRQIVARTREAVELGIYVTGSGSEEITYRLILRTQCEGPARDDDHEPNDKRADAVPIATGVRHEALVVTAFEPDWFSLEGCDGSVEARIDFNPVLGDLTLWLYGADDQDSSNSTDDHEIARIDTAEAEPVQIEVYSNDFPNTYTLTVTRSGCDPGGQ